MDPYESKDSRNVMIKKKSNGLKTRLQANSNRSSSNFIGGFFNFGNSSPYRRQFEYQDIRPNPKKKILGFLNDQ